MIARMSFWDQALPQAASGIVVAAVAAMAALLISKYYGERRARYERNLAAAEDLYRAYGQLFAAWKVWDFHARKPATPPLSPDDPRVGELIQLAAAAEAAYESLLVRIAVEQNLDHNQRAALWCLREAMKDLRYAIRERKPLAWWRSDINSGSDGYQRYQTFKRLTTFIAAILVEQPSIRSASPSMRHRVAALESITGNGAGFTGGHGDWFSLGGVLTAPMSSEPEL
jgi:hypothetical protein